MFWYILALSVRLLLFWGYHSTDFEVHRNWKAIAYSLPMSSWYYEETSKWTLDYPPFFAYFECFLGQIAAKVDPEMVKIRKDEYTSEKSEFFMRTTVVFSEIILILSLWLIGNKVIAGLVLLNPGLVYVDYIHFQYNGMLLGLTLLSIHQVNNKNYIKGAIAFTILLLFKHIYIYYVPAFFFFYLKHYCFDSSKLSVKNLSKVGLTVIFLLFLGLFPFFPHMQALKSRLFPWGRGLTHSYWAPNFWALYNFLDFLANFLATGKLSTDYTKGLVQILDHAVLPNITPLISFAMILIGIALLGRFVWKSDKDGFTECLCLSGMIFFMFGWHVHEKAILMVSIPMITIYEKYPKSVFLVNFFGCFGLFPLVFKPLEQGFVVFGFLAYFWLGKEYVKLNTTEKRYLAGFVPVYFVYILTEFLLQKEAFISLMAVSVYNAVGLGYFIIDFCNSATEAKPKHV